MSLVKTQTLNIHSSCMHLREFCQGRHRSFQSAVLSSLQVGNLNGLLRRRRIVTRSVMEGRETRAKRPAHHGKGMKKKGAEQQQNLKEKMCDDSNGILRTDSLDMGSSSLAPADFCNVEEELDELDEDDELHIFRALVLDRSCRLRGRSCCSLWDCIFARHASSRTGDACFLPFSHSIQFSEAAFHCECTLKILCFVFTDAQGC